MAKPRGYAVFLHASLPKEFRELFADYFGKQIHGQTYLLSSEFEPSGYFVGLSLYPEKPTESHWRVQIPASYVIAVTDVHDPSRVGFVT